jgi:hypothetical protein
VNLECEKQRRDADGRDSAVEFAGDKSRSVEPGRVAGPLARVARDGTCRDVGSRDRGGFGGSRKALFRDERR